MQFVAGKVWVFLGFTEKLRKIMLMHLEYLVGNKKLYFQLTLEAQRLSAQSQQQIQTARYAYQDMLRALLETGIQSGEFREVNPILAARSIFGLLTITVFTSRPTGTPEEMAEDAFDIFFNGILAS